MFSSQEGHLYIRAGLLYLIVSESSTAAKQEKSGRKKKKKNRGEGRCEREQGTGNRSDSNNLHYWHPLALKPSRQPPWLVLFYTIMIPFLGGEGITFISTLYSLWLLSFRLQARGLLWVSVPTSHLKREVRDWGLKHFVEKGGWGMLLKKHPPLPS